MLKGAVVLLLLLTQSSFAYHRTPEAECHTVDLRNQYPLKMRNQGRISWCFAHASSDYLQYIYQIPEQISAADIAINYSKTSISKLIYFFSKIFNSSMRKEPPQTGIAAIAIKRILPQGYCPESVLPSEEWTKVDTRTGSKEQVEILAATMDLLEIQKNIRNGTYRTAGDLPHFYEFKHVDQNEFYDVLARSSRAHVLNRLREKVCSTDRKPFPTNHISMHFHFKGNQSFQRINHNLDNGNPVSIDFSAGILRDYEAKNSINSLHTVLLYGRRFDREQGECQYLLKNSYGPDCDQYAPEILCEGGNIWLPENKLFHTLMSQLQIIKK